MPLAARAGCQSFKEKGGLVPLEARAQEIDRFLMDDLSIQAGKNLVNGINPKVGMIPRSGAVPKKARATRVKRGRTEVKVRRANGPPLGVPRQRGALGPLERGAAA